MLATLLLFAALNSPFDYRYCDLSGIDTNGWHGEIMPIRATNALSNTRQLRMEDIAWLMEAVAERKALFLGEVTHPVPSKEISRSQMNATADGLELARAETYEGNKTCASQWWIVKGPEVQHRHPSDWYDFVNTAYGREMVITNSTLVITNRIANNGPITTAMPMEMFEKSQIGSCIANHSSFQMYAQGQFWEVDSTGYKSYVAYTGVFQFSDFYPWRYYGHRNYSGAQWQEQYGIKTTAGNLKLLIIDSYLQNIAAQCETVTLVMPVRTTCKWFDNDEGEVVKYYADAVVHTFSRAYLGTETIQDSWGNSVTSYARYESTTGSAKEAYGDNFRRGADKYVMVQPASDMSFVVFNGVLRATY